MLCFNVLMFMMTSICWVFEDQLIQPETSTKIDRNLYEQFCSCCCRSFARTFKVCSIIIHVSVIWQKCYNVKQPSAGHFMIEYYWIRTTLVCQIELYWRLKLTNQMHFLRSLFESFTLRSNAGAILQEKHILITRYSMSFDTESTF